MKTALSGTDALGLKPTYRGKVRDIFDLGEQLLIVASDRISAYDVIMDDPVPGKGKILTRMSVEWFTLLGDKQEHHLITADWRQFPPPFNVRELGGRSMLVRKTDRFDLECVVRGYLVGSGWKDYLASGEVCGIALDAGLQEAHRFQTPIFTPAFKAEEGHDRNVDHEEGISIVGEDYFDTLREQSLALYSFAEEYARARGIIIADTKFEFGLIDGSPILIDEIFTPDSSRFWAEEVYRPGATPDSFDKQILRNWLDQTDWNKEPPPPVLPEDLINRIRDRYLDILERLFPGAGGVLDED